MGASEDEFVNIQPSGESSSSPRRLSSFTGLAPILAILSCVLFSCNGELLQFLQLHASSAGNVSPSPMFNLIICHCGGLFFAPHFLLWKPLGFSDGLSMNVQVGSLLIAFLLMGYNYLWLQSARYLSVGLTNAIFQTSAAFVLVASIVVFRDEVERMQFVGVALALGGSFLASGIGDTTAPASSHVRFGAFLALSGAFGYMLYQVVFKYLFGRFKSDARFLAHIGAWVSIWHVVVIFPLALLGSAMGFEAMQFPQGSLMVWGTLLSAVLASTVNAMYICMVMWGSSMLLPCASALSVPFTVGLDVFLHKQIPARLEACGHMMVVLSVVLIMKLHKEIVHYANPKALGALEDGLSGVWRGEASKSPEDAL